MYVVLDTQHVDMRVFTTAAKMLYAIESELSCWFYSRVVWILKAAGGLVVRHSSNMLKELGW